MQTNRCACVCVCVCVWRGGKPVCVCVRVAWGQGEGHGLGVFRLSGVNAQKCVERASVRRFQQGGSALNSAGKSFTFRTHQYAPARTHTRTQNWCWGLAQKFVDPKANRQQCVDEYIFRTVNARQLFSALIAF